MQDDAIDYARNLSTAIEDRVLRGAQVIKLRPSTAMWLVQMMRNALVRHDAEARSSRVPDPRIDIDMYASGSRVLRVNDNADIIEIVAWANNALVARTAFDELCRREPDQSFHQRRRSWVEAERMIVQQEKR